MGGVIQGKSKKRRGEWGPGRKNSKCKSPKWGVCERESERKREIEKMEHSNGTFWKLKEAKIQDVKALSKKQRWAGQGQGERSNLNSLQRDAKEHRLSSEVKETPRQEFQQESNTI